MIHRNVGTSMHKTLDDSHGETKPEESASQSKPLDDRHLAELRASGISDEMIVASGIYSTSDTTHVAKLLGHQPKHHSWGPCMVIPYFTADGKPTDYARVKPDFPRPGKDGDPIKYEAPLRKPPRAYFPPRFAECLADRSKPTIATEGEKKTLAGASCGYPCIGLPGVWSWHQRRPKTEGGKPYGRRELLPELQQLPWQGLVVVIVFDSDMKDKPIVKLASIRLSEALTELGANVSVATLTAGPQGEKTGLDDFIVREGNSALSSLEKLINEAKPAGETPELKPMDWAQMFLDELYRSDEGYLLQWHDDEFFAYCGTHYRPVPENELRAVLTMWLHTHGADSKTRSVNEVLHALMALVRVPFTYSLPCWLGEGGPKDPADWVAMQNGILDVPAALAGKPNAMRDHSPKWFSVNVLPYRYDPGADCPSFKTFLQSVFGDDYQRKDLLQEWTGYCITSRTDLQASMLLQGPRRAGKGVYTRMLRNLAGEFNCASPKLQNLSETFGLAGLVGKTNAIIPDAILGKGDAALGVLETILAITGEDAMEVHRKYLPSLPTYRFCVRFTLGVNDLPKFGDSSGALASRLLFIPFTKSFAGKEDRGLDDRLRGELPGIFNWSLQGLRRLTKKGKFTVPDASLAISEQFTRLSSPIKAFIEDCCAIDETKQEWSLKSELWDKWKTWCIEHGNFVGSYDSFFSKLWTLFPVLDDVRPREDNPGRHRAVSGLRLLSSIEQQEKADDVAANYGGTQS